MLTPRCRGKPPDNTTPGASKPPGGPWGAPDLLPDRDTDVAIRVRWSAALRAIQSSTPFEPGLSQDTSFWHGSCIDRPATQVLCGVPAPGLDTADQSPTPLGRALLLSMGSSSLARSEPDGASLHSRTRCDPPWGLQRIVAARHPVHGPEPLQASPPALHGRRAGRRRDLRTPGSCKKCVPSPRSKGRGRVQRDKERAGSPSLRRASSARWLLRNALEIAASSVTMQPHVQSRPSSPRIGG